MPTTILALLAHAFLSVLAAAQPGGNDSHDDLLIPLTRHESGGYSPDCPGNWPRPLRSCTGPDGDEGIRPALGPVTTADEP